MSTCLKHMWLLYFCVQKDLFSSWDCETGLMQSAIKKDAELVVETYFRLKEKERPLKGHLGEHGGGKQKTSFCMQENLILFSLISMNNTSFKFFISCQLCRRAELGKKSRPTGRT